MRATTRRCRCPRRHEPAPQGLIDPRQRQRLHLVLFGALRQAESLLPRSAKQQARAKRVARDQILDGLARQLVGHQPRPR